MKPDSINMRATVGSVLEEISQCLEAAGVDNAVLDARLLVCAATGESVASVIAQPERLISATEAGALSVLVARRNSREPLAQIFGKREFWSLDFAVSTDVLTPRPDSETLVEAACQKMSGMDGQIRVLDLGTGSGCLLLALLHENPRALGVGVDISAAAVALARQNAKTLGVASRASFAVGDWTAPIDGRFDLVISNPPYIPARDIAALAPEVGQYEPRSALDGGPDGLDAYRALLPLMPMVLAPGGRAFFEMGIGQGEAIGALAHDNGLLVVDMRADIAGIPRVAILRLG